LKVECDVPMAIDLDVHIPIVLTVPQPYEKVTADVGEDAEFEVLAENGQVRTPLLCHLNLYLLKRHRISMRPRHLFFQREQESASVAR